MKREAFEKKQVRAVREPQVLNGDQSRETSEKGEALTYDPPVKMRRRRRPSRNKKPGHSLGMRVNPSGFVGVGGSGAWVTRIRCERHRGHLP